jgi:cyclopropane fatty-acyl-phospholipid synthase-like methyltransferase
MARYKFVAKMLSGRKRVLEVGCGDGFSARIVKQEVEKLTITDFDPQWLADARSNMVEPWVYDTFVHDIVKDGPISGAYDAVYSLDVMEHIPAEFERVYLANLLAPLEEHGVCIIGMPTLESQQYASPGSRAGHVNCKTGSDLKALLEEYFHNVFLFSMNDEVVHTGFSKLAHYIFCVCCDRRA